MHAHFVLAHPEPRSFNGHLVRSGGAALEAEGWSVSISDLYGLGFDPFERSEHFPGRANRTRFDAQNEQRHASVTNTLPDAVTRELARLDRADLLVLQYSMWWRLPPAMLKGWLDRVFACGAAYTSKKRFENGRFAGKRDAVGDRRHEPDTYEHDGRSGDIDLLLWPANFSLAYVGYEILAPFVAYGVEAGLRYSDPAAVEERLKAIVADFRAALPHRRHGRPFDRRERDPCADERRHGGLCAHDGSHSRTHRRARDSNTEMRGFRKAPIGGEKMRNMAAFAVLLIVITTFAAPVMAVEDCSVGEAAAEKAGGFANAVKAAVQDASNCERAYETLAACSLNSSLDNALADIVQSKCEPLFMNKASRAARSAYKKAQDRCDEIAEKNSGTMYQGFAAVCRAGAARDFARKYSGKR